MQTLSLLEHIEPALKHCTGKHVCVAFSGGLDSTVLLHLLAQLAPRLQFQLSAVHVHHGLNPQADDWAAHCERVAASLNVPISIHRVSVERQSADGLEAAARRARHQIFAALDCDWVVLAHHRGDQAETVLHRLMRGAGVHGAAGIGASDPSRRLLRPLLDEPRSALLAWAEAHELHWIEDDSNANNRFTRNFLRNEVLPLLKTRQEGVEGNLARAARLFAESATLLDELAGEDAERIALGKAGSLAALHALGEARARNLLRFLLVKAGELPPATDRLVEALRQLHEASNGVRIVFDAHALCAWRGIVWIEDRADVMPQVRAWQGEASIAWAGGQILFSAGMGQNALRLRSDGSVRIAPRQGGERLRLHAAGPSRAFKPLAQENGIPPWQRERLPCVWQDGVLVWIGGLGANVAYVCDEGEQGWFLECL